MALRNTNDRYGSVAIALHWAGALSTLLMLLTAAWIWVAPDHRVAVGRLHLHGSLGVMLYVVIVVRIAWHFIHRQPRKLDDRPAFNRAANAVQLAMLVSLAVQLLSGPVDVWSGGWPIDVFGWLALPSPFGNSLKSWHGSIGDIHRYSGYLIGALVAIHIAAALKHFLLDRDGTAQRMLGLHRPSAPFRTA